MATEVNKLYKTPKLEQELKVLSSEFSVEDFLGEDLVAAETHLHLGGALSVDDVVSLAYPRSKSLQQEFGSKQKAKEFLLRDRPVASLRYYLNNIYMPFSKDLFADPEILEEIAYRSSLYSYHHGARKIVFRTSIKYGDVSDSERQYSHKGFDATKEFDAYIRGFERAEKETNQNLTVSLMVCFRRKESDMNVAMKMLDTVLKLRKCFGKDRIVGIDLMGQELGYKAKPFRPVYLEALDEGLHLTAHVGEDHEVGPGAILHAIDYLHCHSLGHATSMPADPFATYTRKDGRKKNALIRTLQCKQLRYVEMCLTSNIICGANYLEALVFKGKDKPQKVLKPMDKKSILYPDDAIMAFGDIVREDVLPKVAVSATDGIFPTNSHLAREISLMARNRQLGVEDILGRNLYSIIYSPGPWENTAKLWLEKAKKYIKPPKGFKHSFKDYQKLAESLIKKSRREAQKRLQKRIWLEDIAPEKIRRLVRQEVEDIQGYASRGSG